nr:hypothetical protein [bacterium]
MPAFAIEPGNLNLFAYTNIALCEGPIRGIALDFHGLGRGGMLDTPPYEARLYGKKGVLYISPYDNPWSWMNDVAVRTVDAILDAAHAAYSLAQNLPIVSTGDSMGGLGALIFTRYSRHPIAACAADCPVCDLPLHWGERPDLPRTLYSAFGHYPMPLERALETASPLHQAAALPRIPYHIVHGTADQSVSKAAHSDKLVARMRQMGFDLVYDEVAGMQHCDLTGEPQQRYHAFVIRHAAGQ